MSIVLTRAQVREIDRLAIEEYGVPGVVLMENAGRNAARFVRREMADRGLDGRVVIFCGTGNNGGDGFVVARHLANVGRDVVIALAGDIGRLTNDAGVNYRICKAMQLSIANADDVTLRSDDIVVDALLGTGFNGTVREPFAGLVERINRSEKALAAAIDVPSGLDCDTGEPANACIKADLTVTFVAEKAGFQKPRAREFTGRVIVADIGAPAAIIERVRKIV
ncbi:MAG: NAD(P)H-hydrate epimerase [Phycisphaerales bacterium]|nr:NAD(P)H-hydrate epimerase [Phycisphaerales bacterium]